MFAGAAFTDQADINADNADAVELLTTLNIISGYPDGTFDPEGTVDRAEMAKMIYTIRNGGNDNASAHVDNTTSFTDINGHWAEGYIKYLQNTGIVAGKSATTFDPDSPVTTTEAMKMALALAGYDEKNAELTGPNWSKNTLTLATTIGLTDNVSSAMNAGCTRQDAAQILANVLEATAVRYSAIVENFVNDSKTGLSYGGDPITVGYKWMDLTVYVGRMISSGEMAIINQKDGYVSAGKDRSSIEVDTVNGVDATRWDWDNNLDNWVARTRTLTIKDGQDHTDLVGMEVKVLTGEKVDEVYGVYATGTSNVVETTMDQAEFDDDGIKVDGTTYDIEDDALVYTDNEKGVRVGASALTNGGDIQKVADDVKMIDWDNNGDYETIITKTVSVAKVTSVNSTSVALGVVGSRDKALLGNNATLDFDDDTIYEDVAKNDYAVVTKNLYTNDWIAEKAEVVSGTVDGKVANERRVRVDGEWYTLANDNTKTRTLWTINGGRENFENGDAVTLYVVGGIAYYAESTRGNDANRSVLMVYDTYMNGNSWNGTPQAKVILADGTKKTVDIDTINGAAPAGNINGPVTNLNVGKMYYYEINNDGEYAFYDLVNGGKMAGYEAVGTADDIGIVDSKINGVAIADEAIVFVLIGNNDAEVYTGKTVKDADINDGWGATDNGQYLTETENGFTFARMLNVAIGDNETLRKATSYGYLTTDAMRTKVNGTWYMEYEFFDGENNIVAREETDEDKTDFGKGDIISFAYTGGTMSRAETADSYVMIDDVVHNDDADVVFAAMTGVHGSSLQLLSDDWAQVVADVTSDTKIIYVDSANSNEAEIGVPGRDDYDYSVGKFTVNGVNYYPINVAYVLDNDGDVELLVIDVENQLKDEGAVAETANGTLPLTGTETDLATRISNTTKSKVVFTSNTVSIDGPLSIPRGTTVDWAGVTTINLDDEAAINGNVTLPVVSSVDAGAKVNGTLTIEGTATGLENLAGQSGAKLVLEQAYTPSNASKFFVGGNDMNGKQIPAGTTFTWSNDADGKENPGWVADKLASVETKFADLTNALALSDNVIVTDTVTNSDPLTVNAGETITFEKGVTQNTAGITVKTGGTAIFEDNLTMSSVALTIEDGGSVTVKGTLSVPGTGLKGAGTLTLEEAQNASILK